MHSFLERQIASLALLAIIGIGWVIWRVVSFFMGW
jgi:hypothetical protein